MNYSCSYLEHCEEGSAEFDQLVFKDDLEDWRESTGEDDEEKEDEVMSWRRWYGLVDNGLHRKGKCQDEGLDALRKDGVAAVENDDINEARKEEEEVDWEKKKKLLL